MQNIIRLSENEKGYLRLFAAVFVEERHVRLFQTIIWSIQTLNLQSVLW